jgi:hypothetical protein
MTTENLNLENPAKEPNFDELFESIVEHNEQEARAEADVEPQNLEPEPAEKSEEPATGDPEPIENPYSNIRADFALMVADVILSKVFSVGFKLWTGTSVPADIFRLTTDEAAAILPAFEVVFKDAIQHLKPAHVLMITTAAIYGAKVFEASETYVKKTEEPKKQTASRKYKATQATGEAKRRGRPRKEQSE